MKSPRNQRCEGEDYDFNHLGDFSQFLEEAKMHKAQEHFNLSPKCDQQAQEKQVPEEKKKRPSWKKSFLSLWKSSEKKSSRRDATATSYLSKASRAGPASASGPLYESGSAPSSKFHRPRSGPLTSFFLPSKVTGNESPYICLTKDDKNSVVHSYGPVYLVT